METTDDYFLVPPSMSAAAQLGNACPALARVCVFISMCSWLVTFPESIRPAESAKSVIVHGEGRTLRHAGAGLGSSAR
ncbi:hypothetical protein E2C01_005422 [Portunus trituberculatus]|uniref:Uncharacterized protein n=1 Tax=Portunus trituberculatus TaxID=210409 RepID=A0A5B7CSG0_PORTR|nr:hypothetical protein [Portunus trituberculatus]